MSRLLKTYGLSLPIFAFVFTLSALGFSLFNTQPASAYDVNKFYTLYEKSGNYLYYNKTYETYAIINWSPRINLDRKPNSCGGFQGDANIISNHDYEDCIGMVVNEVPDNRVSGNPNNLWFEQAQYSFEVGDFDHTETISVGGGRIHDWGSSLDTVNGSHQFARSNSGATNGSCDADSPTTTSACSVLIIFGPSYSGDFKITLDNDANDPSHEYWYKGPKHGHYRTLTFNPNGGSVDYSAGDADAIWAHKPGDNLLREYLIDDPATNFPTPVRENCKFNGWYDASSGGTKYASRTMSNDETLYAQWTCFHLIPTLEDVPTTVEAGESFTVKAKINNDGNGSSAPASYSLTRTINGASGVVGSPLTAIPYIFPGNNSIATVFNYPETSTDRLPGTVMCYVLSVAPHSATDSGTVSSSFSISPPVNCVTIVKRPKMQVWGGDLSVAGDVKTSRKTISPLIAHPLAGRTFGSWVEYAIFARGSIFVDAKRGAASGSAFAGSGLGTNLDCSYSTLTFSNAAAGAGCVDGDKKGGYPTASLPEIKNSFPGGENRTTNETIAPNSLDSGTYNWGSNNVTLTTSELDPGKSVIIKAPSGTVTIAGSQKYYGGSYDKISDIPQLVIIANNIVINNDVDNVDAWLVATNNAKTGSIKTCVDVAKSSGECNTPLIVNGPVVTNKLYLYRTAGSDGIDSSGAPAEVFNLRADAYLWAYVRSIGHIRTVRTTELPPRY